MFGDCRGRTFSCIEIFDIEIWRFSGSLDNLEVIKSLWSCGLLEEVLRRVFEVFEEKFVDFEESFCGVFWRLLR